MIISLNTQNRVSIVVSVIFTLFIYLSYGYQLGIVDGPEFLPFAKAVQNPFLYKNDLFMKSMLAMPWNERTIFGLFFSVFGSLDWASYIVHGLLTFFLVLGVIKLAELILKNWCWAMLFSIQFFFITLKIEIGATTLYYHNIQGETFANTFIIWALVAIVQKREKWAYLFIGLATYFHALIGFQSFLFITSAHIIYMVFNKEFDNAKNIAICVAVYITTCSWIVVLIFLGNQSAGIGSNEDFMNLTYHFSLKCHFDPLSFSRKGYILIAVSLIAGFYYYRKQQPLLFFILMTLSIGYVVYLIGYYANSYLITSSWWFRTNMWVMILGQIAVMGVLKNVTLLNNIRIYLLASVVVVAIGIRFLNRPNIPTMYPWKDLAAESDEIRTALACKKHSEIDAVFIHPLTFTALKYFGERASYVEYGRYVRSKKDIKLWYNRLGEVYKLNTAIETARNPDFETSMNENYNNLNDLELRKLGKQGVKYAVFEFNHPTTFPSIYSNESFKIIKIF